MVSKFGIFISKKPTDHLPTNMAVSRQTPHNYYSETFRDSHRNFQVSELPPADTLKNRSSNMTQEEESRDNQEWDRVFSKGAYCIAWPVLFSTGVGLGLACVNLESQLWNKGQKDSVTFENPWLKVKEKSEDKPVTSEDEEPGGKLGRKESARLTIPRPHWRPAQEPVPPVPLEKDRRAEESLGKKDRRKEEESLGKKDRRKEEESLGKKDRRKEEESLGKKDRREAEESLGKKDRRKEEESLGKKDRRAEEESLGKKDRREAEESLGKKDRRAEEESLGKKDRREADHTGKDHREEELAGKEALERGFPEREQPERETRDAKPCPRAQKKKAKSHKKEPEEVKGEKNIEVESDPTLLVD